MRYRPAAGWEQGLRAQPAMAGGMRDRAKVAARAAERAAPVKTGTYRRLIYAHGNRVVAHDFAWHWVEFGNVTTPAYAPLRRGTISAGLTFMPHPKLA